MASLALGASGLVRAAPHALPDVPAPWDAGGLPSGSRGSRRMATAARALLVALNSQQRARVWCPHLSDPARTKWSNFPAGASPRPGVPLGELDDGQRTLVHDLLRASTSSQGYHKMTGALRADDVLHDLEGANPLFGASAYYVTVFGSPDERNWAWMLTGHHMSAIFTVAGERTGFTPMFTGAQPHQIPTGVNAGWQALPHDAGRAAELLDSLSVAQKRIAIIAANAPGDVYAGPGRQGALSTFAGINARELDDAQQRLLWLLVREFVGNAEFEAAEAQLSLVKKSWQSLHFAWQGPPPDASARYYFRVHGPRILIEYDVQEPLSRQGGHVHAITRDPANDYGVDWLALHYQESNAHPDGPPGGPEAPGGPPGGPALGWPPHGPEVGSPQPTPGPK